MRIFPESERVQIGTGSAINALECLNPFKYALMRKESMERALRDPNGFGRFVSMIRATSKPGTAFHAQSVAPHNDTDVKRDTIYI